MGRSFISLISSLLVTANVGLAAPVVLQIDNTHSSIQFSVPFMGFSEVTGRFEKFCGQLSLDENDMRFTTLELFIDASSINTGLKIRDRDLVEKYLAVKRYPVIRYKSKSVRSMAADRLDVIGELYLTGITKELRISLSIIGDFFNSKNALEMGLKLQPVTINRTDYGILEGSVGSGSVGDTITVTAAIRVRDVTPFRKDFDVRFPEQALTSSIPFTGSYMGNSGARVRLITEDGKQFLSFSDDE